MTNPRICSIPDCDNPILTVKHGLCCAHHKRKMRHGDPMAGGTFRKPKADSCGVLDCDSPVYCAGYCGTHYHRFKKHGDPLKTLTAPSGSLLDFIESNVHFASDDCLAWPFTGSTDGREYGHLYYKGKTVKAHRLMCHLAHGNPPTPKHHAAHSCGRGREGCVNPRHLYWATATENAADKEEHGTLLRGSAVGNSKLSDDDVLTIRRLQGAYLQREIADMFGISRSMVGAIHKRKRWEWLP